MNEKNAVELIEFAATHSAKEIKQEIARQNPEMEKAERVKFISEDRVEITTTISRKAYDQLERVKSLEARNNPKMSFGEAIEVSVATHIYYRDPVAKAERNAGKPDKKETELWTSRAPLTAAQKHAAMFVNKGKCTHKDPSGKACGSDRYIDVHHIIEVARGGTNEPCNLTTLCEFHHRMLHRKKKTELPTFEEWIDEMQSLHGQ